MGDNIVVTLDIKDKLNGEYWFKGEDQDEKKYIPLNASNLDDYIEEFLYEKYNYAKNDYFTLTIEHIKPIGEEIEFDSRETI